MYDFNEMLFCSFISMFVEFDKVFYTIVGCLSSIYNKFISVLYTIYNFRIVNIFTLYYIIRNKLESIYNKIINEDGLEEINKNTIVIKYHYKGNEYKIIVPKKRGPSKIYDFQDLSDEELNNIRKFMGPFHNFHDINTTPKMLGYNSLNISYYSDENLEFNENDVIKT